MPRLIFLLCVLMIQGCHSRGSIGQRASWTLNATTHFRLRAQAGVRSEKNLALIGEKMEAIQTELLQILQGRAMNLRVFFLKDRETLTSYTGFPANGYTDTEKGIIYFVDKDPFHLALRHELMHALSWKLWGPAKTYWISEGLAVFASRTCGGYSLHALAHDISRRKNIVSFDSLENNFDFKSLEPSLQSASFVKFVYEQYGLTALKNIWQQDRNKHIDMRRLEAEWKLYIDRNEFETTIDWSGIHRSGCE